MKRRKTIHILSTIEDGSRRKKKEASTREKDRRRNGERNKNVKAKYREDIKNKATLGKKRPQNKYLKSR